MAELQTERSFVVELTPEGVQEIQSHKNIYTEDTKPIPLSGREWSTKNYITLWTGILVSIPVYMMASALLSAGLTWYQALFICVLGHTLVLIPSILLGKFGSRYGASFPVLSKMVFGPKGTAIPHHHPCLHGLPVVRDFRTGSAAQLWTPSSPSSSRPTPVWRSTASSASACLYSSISTSATTAAGPSAFLEDFAGPHPDHSQRRSHCLGLLAGQSEGRICRTVHHSGGRRQRRELLVSVLPLPDSMIAFDATIALNFSDYTRHAKTEGPR